MAFTPNDEKAVAHMANVFREMNTRANNNDFISNSTRASRKYGGDTYSQTGGGIEGIASKKIKDFWKTIKKDYTDSHIANRMKDSHERLIKGIEQISNDLTKDGMKLSGSIADAYKKIVSDNKGNKKLHGAVAESLHSYSTKVGKMDDLLKENSVKYKKGMNAEFRALNEEITKLAAELKKAGIAVETISATQAGPRSRKWASTNPNLNVSEYSTNVNAASGQILKIHQNFENDLEKTFTKELAGRVAIVAGLLSVAADIVKIGSKFADVAQSRLQNGLTETDLSAAIRTGLSPDEMNQWMNANRNVLRTINEDAHSFSIESERSMHSFGLFGAAAMEASSALNKLSMDSGIKASVKNNVQLEATSRGFQQLTGASDKDSTAALQEVMQSTSYLSSVVGKSSDDRIDIAKKQLVNLTSISRSSGFLVGYSQKMLQEQMNTRYGSLIDQVKKSVLAPMSLKALADYAGTTYNSSEASAWEKVHSGVAETDLTPEELQSLYAVRTRLGTGMAAAYKNTATTLGSSNGSDLGPNAGSRFTYEALGVSSEEIVDLVGAAARQPTYKASTVSPNAAMDEVQAARDSLSTIENAYLTATKVYINGIEQNPLGGTISGIASTLGNAGMLALALRGSGLVPTVARAGGTLLSSIAGSRAAGSVVRGGTNIASLGLKGIGVGLSSIAGSRAAGSVVRGGTNIASLGLKGIGVGLVGSGMSYGGEALKENALKNGAASNNTIFDGDTGGAMLDTAGKALSWGATGAMIGSAVLPGIGTAIGAVVGGLAGSIDGLYENRDTIERNYNTVFGSDAKLAAVGGQQLDAAGNIIDDNGNAQLDVSTRMADSIDKQNTMIQTDQNERRSRENSDDTKTELERRAAEQSRSQQLASLLLSQKANTAFGDTISAINRA